MRILSLIFVREKGRCGVDSKQRRIKIQTEHYWKELGKIEDSFYEKIQKLEQKMQKETGIEDIEFFWCDNEIVGIGNMGRTMKLIHREYL